jgi:phosphate transport system substrate-binding protein
MTRGRATAIVAILTAACGGRDQAPPTPAAPVRIVISGASSMVPLCSETANLFMKSRPGVLVEVSSGTSHSGLAAVTDGTATIGNSDIFASAEQASALEDHRVAVVGIGVFANRGAFNDGVKSLSMAQLRGIFAGRIRNWKELGGRPQPITVLHRSKDSGTRRIFTSVVMQGEDFADGGEIGSSGKMQTALRETPGAISYLVLSYDHPDLKRLALDGVSATNDSVAEGRYPLWAYQHMYVRPPVNDATRALLAFMQTPPVQEEILPKLGFIAMSRMKVSRDHD